jgi:hypothetical protein
MEEENKLYGLDKGKYYFIFMGVFFSVKLIVLLVRDSSQNRLKVFGRT